MTALNHQMTLSSIDTIYDPLNLQTLDNIVLPTTPTVRNATATMPVTSYSGNGASIVYGGRFNYAKIQPFVNVASQAFTMHVIGWSKDRENNWNPFLLTTVSVTSSASGTGRTIHSATLFPGLTYARTNGDCKMFAGNAAICNAGGILVDVLGFERVEIVLSVASGTVSGTVLAAFV